MKSIYFCFPFKGVGGVAVLFVRVAEFLASSGMAKCYLIDYEDGHMSKIKDSKLTELIPYSESQTIKIPDNVIVIFQSMTPWSIFPNLKFGDRTKFIFWSCHPLNLIPSIPGFRNLTTSSSFLSKLIMNSLLLVYKIRVRNFLLFLHKRHSIFFMDGNNLDVTSDMLSVKILEPKFLPIPANNKKQIYWKYDNSNDSDFLNFLWLGRVVDFKYFPLKRFLKDLNDSEAVSNSKVRITIVGKGDYHTNLKEDEELNNNFQIRYIDHIDLHKLDEFIIKNASIVVAMGTSALESAKLGVPTLVLNFSYKEIEGSYDYCWLHETKEYNLGKSIGANDTLVSNSTLSEKIIEFQNSAKEISSRDLNYFKKNHDLAIVSKKLFHYSDTANCYLSDISDKGFFKKSYIYRVFRYLRSLRS